MTCPTPKINRKDTFSLNCESCCLSLTETQVINIVGALGERIKRTQPNAGIQEDWAPGKD